jgi:uncharacterized glyoxalase superfamily protein PhnB
VKRNRSIPQATVIPVLIYPDVRAAVEWLGAAFGFVERVRIGETIGRSSASAGEPSSLVTSGASGERRGPGEVTHSVMVRVDDATAHCERAKAQGARIVMEPTDFEYGERQYTAEDPAGHQWTSSETSPMSPPRNGAGHPSRRISRRLPRWRRGVLLQPGCTRSPDAAVGAHACGRSARGDADLSGN